MSITTPIWLALEKGPSLVPECRAILVTNATQETKYDLVRAETCSGDTMVWTAREGEEANIIMERFIRHAVTFKSGEAKKLFLIRLHYAGNSDSKVLVSTNPFPEWI